MCLSLERLAPSLLGLLVATVVLAGQDQVPARTYSQLPSFRTTLLMGDGASWIPPGESVLLEEREVALLYLARSEVELDDLRNLYPHLGTGNEAEQREAMEEGRRLLLEESRRLEARPLWARARAVRIGDYDFGRSAFPFHGAIAAPHFPYSFRIPDSTPSSKVHFEAVKAMGREPEVPFLYILVENHDAFGDRGFIEVTESRAADILKSLHRVGNSLWASMTGKGFPVVDVFLRFQPLSAGLDSLLHASQRFKQVHARILEAIVVTPDLTILSIFRPETPLPAAPASDPGDPQVLGLIEEGDRLFESRRFTEAEDVYLEAVKKQPGLRGGIAAKFFARGRTFELEDSWSRAQLLFRMTLHFEYRNPEYHRALARVCRSLGQLEKAADHDRLASKFAKEGG